MKFKVKFQLFLLNKNIQAYEGLFMQCCCVVFSSFQTLVFTTSSKWHILTSLSSSGVMEDRVVQETHLSLREMPQVVAVRMRREKRCQHVTTGELRTTLTTFNNTATSMQHLDKLHTYCNDSS